MFGGDGHRAAGAFEVWAARAWNVLNEGRPFSIVYPVLVLLCAVPAGLAPDGGIGWALLGSVGLALVLSRFSFPLRWRALLWLVMLVSLPLLRPWEALPLIAGALAGWVFFTVVVWGSVYYHLRTGAPWTNGLRFWRLVLTNSDPTSGNALEQVPKLILTLSAGNLLAEDPSAASALSIALVAALAAAAGTWAWHRFATARLPSYPARHPAEAPAAALAKRVYVIVVDGLNRGRLWQADAPVMDRLAREGTEYLAVEPAYPARTVVCFSSMLTGASPDEHGMRSNFAPRLGVRVESLFDVLERNGRRGRLVGIAHLLDPFGEDVVRSVTSVQPTSRIDHSLAAEGRRVVEEEDPDLLVLQLLAADQLGHVRGVRSPEYLDQVAETDRHVADFLAFLEERGRLEDATVILMADHGQGRGIGGHGHLDWGERPVPFVVWGAGARPGHVSREPRSVCELASTISTLLGVEAPAAARGRPLVPQLDPCIEPSTAAGRALAVVVARDEEPAVGRVLAGLPSEACGLPVDVLLVDDGSSDATPAIGREHGAEVISHPASLGLGAALRTGLAYARERGYGAAVYLDGDGEYDPADFSRVLEPVARGRADYVLGSRFLGHREGMTWHRDLANRLTTALVGTLCGTIPTDAQTGYRAFSARALRSARIAHDYNYAQVLTLSLWGAGIEPVEVPVGYRRRTSGRSFVRYPEYLVRVAPAIWREWRTSRAARASSAAPIAPASANGQAESLVKSGSTAVSGPNGASGRPVTSEPPKSRASA
ncbi:MAG: alkaline phosphatase family protein [Thermoleophilaceae bacterium]|nr:alkaline phosphatase family protein [Thermoleophilaceae bacterium]